MEGYCRAVCEEGDCVVEVGLWMSTYVFQVVSKCAFAP